MQQIKNMHLFLSKQDIEKICIDIAAKINSDYKQFTVNNANEYISPNLVAIAILKGSIFFIADILRHVKIPFIIDFVKLSSYGKGIKSSGTVTILQDISIDIKNKHVIIFDEIVDSGRTLSFYLKRLRAAQPASIKLCALIDKKDCRHKNSFINVDYTGIETGSDFLVGYGLDYDEQFRNLPDIYRLEI